MDQEIQQEPLSSSERFETADEMVALHARMAMNGEALRPDNLELPEVKAEQLTHLDKTIAIAANGSTKERVGYWENEWQKMIAIDESLVSLDGKGKLEKEKEIWSEKMIQDFKSTVNKDYVNRLKLKNIGGIDLNDFNQETANQIYQRYFADQGQGQTVEIVVMTEGGQEKAYIPSNLNQFIDDVIAAYNNDYDLIVKDLDVLEWYAGIFGSATEEERSGETPKKVHAHEVIKELIHTRIKLENEAKKQELVEQANETKDVNGAPTTRPNWLNEKEEPILSWLHQASQLKTRTIAREPVVVQSEEIQPTAQLPRPEPTPPLKLEPSTEEDIKIYFTHPDELLKMPKKNRFEALPTENLRAADAFCRLLRERIKERGEFVPAGIGVIRNNFKDEQTGINIPVSSREDIEDARFDGHGFLQNHLPLAIWAQVRIHATLLLKGPEKAPDGRWRVLIYNPSREGEEREYFEYLNITEDFEVYKQRRTQQLQSAFDPVTQTYFDKEPGSPVGVYIDKDELESHLYWEWFNKGLPPDRTIEKNNLATELLETGEYDFSLKDDQELPADIVAGKIQRFQFDGKNCIPICFFTSALRYAAKPGDNEFKRTGIKQFKEDFFGIRILTREEILAGIKPVETATGTTSIEAKSFTDILETIKEKAKTDQPCEMQFNEEGLKMILDSLIPSIELKKDPITANFELIQPAEVAISDQQGTIKLPLRIKAGPLGKILGEPEVTLSLTLDEQLNYASVKSEPEEVFGQNVSQTIQQKPLSFYLKDHLQKQSDQQRANIEIESVGLQFTEDDKLALTIRGKKR